MRLSINLLATFAVIAVVIFLPLIDRRVCRRFHVQPSTLGGNDPHQRRLLMLRTGILHVVFLLYGLTVAYLTIFSRSAGEEYLIHIALMNDVREAITFDTTYIGVLESILENGLVTGLSNIHIQNIADVSQVYLNIMLFIPFGYLAPYCFARFRTRPILRPTAAGFVVSFFVENLQLILKRGFYDADDLLSNTVGAFIGALLYRIFAYAVTHPNWRQELHALRRWRRKLRRHRVYPFAAKALMTRSTLYASDEQSATAYYEHRLGFRPIGRSETEQGVRLLYRMGSTQLEVICVGSDVVLPPQYLTFTVGNLERVHKKLSRHYLDVTDYTQDEFSNLRKFTFTGPDNLTVTIMG